MGVHVYPNFESLPDQVAAFMDEAARRSFFMSAPWFRVLFETTGMPGDELRIYAAEKGGRPLAVLIVRAKGRPQGRLGARMLQSCAHIFYTSCYAPILDAAEGDEGVREIVAAIAGESPPFDAVRLDILDHGSPVFENLAAGFRDVGFFVQPFFNFGNWYEDVTRPMIDAYLARRSPNRRHDVRRRTRKLEKSGRARIEIITGGPDLETALADYERVYTHSWKLPEPFPRCIPAIVRAAAKAGVLRLPLLYVDGEPAAGQIWIVSGGCASSVRAAYDQKFAGLGVAAVLTYQMVRHVIEVDKVREIEMGRGDDPYKRTWFSRRRERWGIMAFNRRTAKGLLAAARHLGAHAAVTFARKILRRADPAEFRRRGTPPE